MVEVKQFDQYVVRIDGSGRVTIRNRKFLRQYSPAYSQRPPSSIGIDLNHPQQVQQRYSTVNRSNTAFKGNPSNNKHQIAKPNSCFIRFTTTARTRETFALTNSRLTIITARGINTTGHNFPSYIPSAT